MREGRVTLGGVLGAGGCSSRRIQGPVQVSPELLLVLGVHQFIHTLVHDVGLGKGEFPLIIPLMLVLRFHTDWDLTTLSGAVSAERNRIFKG